MDIITRPGQGIASTSSWTLCCPRCKLPVLNEGFGFVSCSECNTLMREHTAEYHEIKVV